MENPYCSCKLTRARSILVHTLPEETYNSPALPRAIEKVSPRSKCELQKAWTILHKMALITSGCGHLLPYHLLPSKR